MSSLLEKLADFCIENTIEKIPVEVKLCAVNALADYVAVTMAGAHSVVAQNCLSYIKQRQYFGHSKLFAQNISAEPELAALFNGCASHALDFDDVSWATIGHPTVAVAPVVFALTQDRNLSGADALNAYVVGVEVMHQIARWTMPTLSENGWHTTPVYGVFGATASACVLLGMSKEQTANALAIAASRASGIRANFGTQTKALHAGLCAMSGIECARLAMSGITGHHDAIDACDGFAQCFAKEANFQSMNTTLGSYWDLKENGLVFKQYPCCSGSHPTNDVWDDFVKQHQLTENDVLRIEAGVSLLGPRELNCHNPQNAIQAKFSLEYAIASRLVFGPINLDSFIDEKVLDYRIQNLMRRIDVKIDPELAKLGFIGTAPIRMKVFLKNGSVHHLANDLAQGNPEKPLTQDQFHQKFISCLSTTSKKGEAERWWDSLRNIENLSPKEFQSLG